jgi:hypothetical protein
VNEKEFVKSLHAAHKFYADQLGLADILAGPTSLSVNKDFNRIALDTDVPYTDIFFAGLRMGQYNFTLVDYSYFQFSFENSDDLRYAFYPSPFTSGALDQINQLQTVLVDREAADVELLMNFAEAMAVNYSRPLVRYEYNIEQYEVGNHPVSHFHIGTYGDDRWVAQKRLTPMAFVLLIAKLYFRSYWEVVTDITNERRENEFDLILEKERDGCALTPGEKFSCELKSFYLA